MSQSEHERLLKEYNAYTCKMINQFDETGEVEILGFGKWVEEREQPQRPNESDNGR